MDRLAEITEMYGKTHTIEKKFGTEVNLDELQDNQSVCMGDGKTFYWLLTKKPQPPTYTQAEVLELLRKQRENCALTYAKKGEYWTQNVKFRILEAPLVIAPSPLPDNNKEVK